MGNDNVVATGNLLMVTANDEICVQISNISTNVLSPRVHLVFSEIV